MRSQSVSTNSNIDVWQRELRLTHRAVAARRERLRQRCSQPPTTSRVKIMRRCADSATARPWIARRTTRPRGECKGGPLLPCIGAAQVRLSWVELVMERRTTRHQITHLDVMPLMSILRFSPRAVYSGVLSSICTLRRAACVSNAQFWSPTHVMAVSRLKAATRQSKQPHPLSATHRPVDLANELLCLLLLGASSPLFARQSKLCPLHE